VLGGFILSVRVDKAYAHVPSTCALSPANPTCREQDLLIWASVLLTLSARGVGLRLLLGFSGVCVFCCGTLYRSSELFPLH
jgi:hypothetical protein